MAAHQPLSTIRRLALCLVLMLGFVGSSSPETASVRSAGGAVVLTIDGAIGPASASYIIDGLREAREGSAELVVIEMDTPGGLDTSMRDIIRAILATPIPVVAYVHPSGARAASAGTYILYASHVAAMTPGTNLGAATPVQLGGAPPEPGKEGGDEKAPSPKGAGERKAINDAVAYIRSLAELRGRNADWAESAVREAASLSAEAALKLEVVDVVAADTPSLLGRIDGMRITVDGKERVLATSGLTIRELEPDWMTRLLATITDPNVALILMMIGLYGLIFEFMNPGAVVPGTVGAISLLFGLYALAVLPVDLVGLALILLGMALMVGEAFAPSFGILGLGGLVSFVLGAALLFDTDVPEFRVDWSVIAALGAFGAVLMIAVARVGLRSHRKAVTTGQQEMIGARGKILDWRDGAGHVFVHSERWNAIGPPSLEVGESVAVEAIDGLVLQVTPIAPPEP